MLSAATLPAATARMTVAGPDTASPPAKTLPLPGTKDELSAWMAPQRVADAARLKGLGMDGLADGHDHIVAGDAHRRGVGFLGAGAPVRAHPPDDLGLGPQRRHPAVLVRLDPGRGVQGQGSRRPRPLASSISSGRAVISSTRRRYTQVTWAAPSTLR